MSHDYVLATGEADVERLRILNSLYGPGSRQLLLRAGLRAGQRVAVLGCGSGNMSCWIAEQVGPSGAVVGVDVSPEQVEQSRALAARLGLPNASFAVADVRAPGLPAGTFDLAYCRLVLMHLPDPPAGLGAMRTLVRPGGVVVCEEMDLGRAFCQPSSAAFTRMFELNLALGDRRGVHFRLGSSLHQLFRDAGWSQPEVGWNQPVVLRGVEKRLLRLSFEEFAPAVVNESLTDVNEVKRVIAEFKALEADEGVLFAMPPIGQVNGTRDPDAGRQLKSTGGPTSAR
jgi:SAM-dependent methyltransferase